MGCIWNKGCCTKYAFLNNAGTSNNFQSGMECDFKRIFAQLSFFYSEVSTSHLSVFCFPSTKRYNHIFGHLSDVFATHGGSLFCFPVSCHSQAFLVHLCCCTLCIWSYYFALLVSISWMTLFFYFHSLNDFFVRNMLKPRYSTILLRLFVLFPYLPCFRYYPAPHIPFSLFSRECY